ncbi:MAG: glycine--tRNA ligase, partial [Candidatus Omnitrophica bacterium]|nr:glycine--tRNA ligase [Candidatus Omnitrophota bacterium]
MEATKVTLDQIVSLCKRRGFIFQSSEIYGGLGACWDYGPLGVELKQNIKTCWWDFMVRAREDVVGMDGSILMHPEVWVASGHVSGFHDPLVDCKESKNRYRFDQLLVYRHPSRTDLPLFAFMEDNPDPALAKIKKQAKGTSVEDYSVFPLPEIPEHEYARVLGPDASEPGTLTKPRQFNLMFKTHVGAVEETASVVYLRPETAQAIFVNFRNVQQTTRMRVPFGIAQIGKAFRNEIVTKAFIFRSREFEQMEMQYFIPRDEDDKWYEHWREVRFNYYTEVLGIPKESLRWLPHPPDKLAHYAKAAADVTFLFPMGWQEIEGVHNRGDFDLSQHARFSGKAMGVFDEDLRTAFGKLDDAKKKDVSERYYQARLRYLTKSGVEQVKAEKQAKEDAEGLAKGQYIPHVIEPSAGVDRLILALVANAYTEVTSTDEKGKSETRVVMKFHPRVAPIKVGVFPLLKNKPELVAKAKEVFESLRGQMMAFYD